MRVYCVWCKQWLEESQICHDLPAGCLYPVGAALCVQCCVHAVHGIPTDRRGA